jgi:threonine dehydrogenase-like Zn-dependent dehydrogenase
MLGPVVLLPIRNSDTYDCLTVAIISLSYPTVSQGVPMNHTQAWCWHAPGEPTQLTLTDLPLSPLAPDEVLVANRVIAFNPVDWKLMEYGHSNWQDGQVPGVDGMGTIVALGANVSHLRLGARVAYHTDLRHQGSFARHTQVPARALLPVPDALSDEAAAVPASPPHRLAGAGQAATPARGSATHHRRGQQCWPLCGATGP